MIADLVIIGIIVLCASLGYIRGLIKVAVKIICFVVALIIALILYRPISNYIINNTQIVPNLTNTIKSKIYKEENVEDYTNIDELKNKINTENIQNSINKYSNNLKEETAVIVSKEIAITAVRVITWMCLFISIKLLMLIINLFASFIEEIPIIKQFNKAGGLTYGIFQGLLITYIGLAIFSIITPMIGENGIHAKIEKSYICKMMYENNVILKILL